MRLRVKCNLKPHPEPWTHFTEDVGGAKKAKGILSLYSSCQGTAGMCVGP